MYCHRSMASLQNGRQPIKVPDLNHESVCNMEFKAGPTFESWDEFTKCREAFSKATSIQFCTMTVGVSTGQPTWKNFQFESPR